MNYYEHHLGDYLRDTAHLSMVEDGAYRRLLDAYYIRETLLPLSEREVFRLVRAQSKQDREAVQTVLREFFTETPEGWKHSRCDREIERFRSKSEKAKASIRVRWDRARGSERTEHESNNERNTGVSTDGIRTNNEGNTPRARPQTPDTSNHTVAELPRERTRGARLPPDWTPEPVHMAFAEGLGLRNGAAAAELAKFRDYWTAQPGQKGVKTDWPATWRNWVRRAVEDRPGKPSPVAGDVFAGAE